LAVADDTAGIVDESDELARLEAAGGLSPYSAGNPVSRAHGNAVSCLFEALLATS
jgi:hypothetical protein